MRLRVPLKKEDVMALKAGDEVYLSGTIYTARDKAHQRALEEGKFPEDLSGGVVFHCGPIVEKKGDGWRIVAVGPTTSSRMNSLAPKFIKTFGVRAVIGKGGMDDSVASAMEGEAVYLAMTGGCAAVSASKIKKVSCVHWLDLGVPEAVWCLEAEELGPLIVAIDAHGNSIYRKVDEKVRKNLEGLI